MQSKIPLPTDNIYKFYALFGLLLFITSAYLFVTLYNENRVRQEYRFLEVAKLETNGELSTQEESYKTLLKNQAEIDTSNKKVYNKWIGFFFGVSISFIVLGFGMWQLTIQPRQDKIAKLEVEKLELEIEQLKKNQATSVLSKLRRIKKT